MIHIAICEDDPIYLHELEKTIKETKGLSAEIHPCSSPEERSKLYGKNFVPYDIVLMDIELPEKSGINANIRMYRNDHLKMYKITL